jgi:prepilin-type N-terminal cleavage/methylation domain-containing protein/prepilin-type processing-associated H-X9-DG protein
MAASEPGRVENRRAAALVGFTLIEVLVCIAIITILLGIILAGVEKGRHKAYITTCASNLRQIGQALLMYAQANRGEFPRTAYDPADTKVTRVGNGFAAADPFGQPPAVPANDVTAAVYLLAKRQQLPPSLFVCTYNDVTTFEIDSADPREHSNFADWTKNLSYSFANMYPAPEAVKAGYRWDRRVGPTFVVAADLNPGGDLSAITPASPPRQRARANSRNHEREGQNVLYGDGHVNYEPTAFVGVQQDNIYTSRDSVGFGDSPVDAADSVLLPRAVGP